MKAAGVCLAILQGAAARPFSAQSDPAFREWHREPHGDVFPSHSRLLRDWSDAAQEGRGANTSSCCGKLFVCSTTAASAIPICGHLRI